VPRLAEGNVIGRVTGSNERTSFQGRDRVDFITFSAKAVASGGQKGKGGRESQKWYKLVVKKKQDDRLTMGEKSTKKGIKKKFGKGREGDCWKGANLQGGRPEAALSSARHPTSGRQSEKKGLSSQIPWWIRSVINEG